MSGLPPAPKASPRIVLTLRIDTSERLEVKTTVTETGLVQELGPFPLPAARGKRQGWWSRLFGRGEQTVAARPAPSSPPVARVVLEEPSPAISGGRLVEALGVGVMDGQVVPILAAGTVLPTERTERFSNTEEGQSLIQVRLYRGNGTRTEDCTPLGVFALTGFALVGPGQVALELTFAAGEQRLELRVVDRRDGRPIEVKRVHTASPPELVH